MDNGNWLVNKDFYKEQAKQGFYGIVRWQIEDVHDHRKDKEFSPWTDEQATEWLIANESNIQQIMTEHGWDVFEYTMKEEEN